MELLINYIQEALIKKDTVLKDIIDSDIETPPKKRKKRVITKQIQYYACYADKVNQKLYCYSLGDFTKSSDGRKDAENEAKKLGHPYSIAGWKWKGVTHRDGIGSKCPAFGWSFVFH